MNWGEGAEDASYVLAGAGGEGDAVDGACWEWRSVAY